jgi:threonine aldolase
MTERDEMQILEKCTRFVVGHYPHRPGAMFAELAAFAGSDALQDFYGAGALIEDFEAEVAALLGKPAALFMPSGTMVQQIALRIWAERQANCRVAFHPTCHLEIHEQGAYRILADLQAIQVGSPHELMTLDDLKGVRERFGALLIELPQREIGGSLPPWEALVEMVEWARKRGIVVHLDGARLWECKPFYGRDYAEIAGLFDSVYVSFYKILDGIAGAILAGPEDLVREAKVWQRRYGGNLVRLYPLVLSAQKGLHERLGKMGAYHEKALAIAEALDVLPEIKSTPNPPHTNMMHLYVRGERGALWEAALDLAEEERVWLAKRFSPSPLPGYQKTELTVGDATLDIPTEEIVTLYGWVIAKARNRA